MTEKSADGSKFMLRSRLGDVVLALGSNEKSVFVSILPKVTPNDLTVDEILVMWRAALNGFSKSTVTWLMLLTRPVVASTDDKIQSEKIRKTNDSHTFECCRVQKIGFECRKGDINFKGFKSFSK